MNTSSHTTATILGAKATACVDLAKLYYGDLYKESFGEQLALIMMAAPDDTMRKIRDESDNLEYFRSLVDRAFSSNIGWAPRSSLAVQPTPEKAKRLTLADFRHLEDAEPLSSDEMREILAKLPQSYWDGVAQMMADQARKFEEVRKSTTPTYEDMHRPFDL